MVDLSHATAVPYVVWGAVVLLTAVVAYRKGRNPWMWAVLAVCIALFALLVVVILPARPAVLTGERQA